MFVGSAGFLELSGEPSGSALAPAFLTSDMSLGLKQGVCVATSGPALPSCTVEVHDAAEESFGASHGYRRPIRFGVKHCEVTTLEALTQ
jgi:hypothetical protein